MPRHAILHPSVSTCIDPNQCALAIMTKAPRAGEVKTRLVPPLAPTEAAELNACFLSDLAASISCACTGSRSVRRAACGIAVHTPPGTEAIYDTILPSNFFLMPQRGDTFGERLIFAAEDLFKIGFASVCLINSDSPTVPAESFTEAVRVLAEPGERIVLGPSDDGGYYLIGLQQVYRRLFEKIDWSTERALDQTKRRAAELGLEVCELPPGFDIDDQHGLARLCDELLRGNARDNIAPRTQKFLREIVARRGGSGFGGAQAAGL